MSARKTACRVCGADCLTGIEAMARLCATCITDDDNWQSEEGDA